MKIFDKVKKLKFAILVLLSNFFFYSSAYAYSPGLHEITVAESNARKEPSKSSPSLVTLKNGEQVYVDKFVGKWGHTEYGWISGKNLKFVNTQNRPDAKNKPLENNYNEGNNATNSDDTSKDDGFLSILFGWKGFLLILGFLLLEKIFNKCSGSKCPKCNKCTNRVLNKELIDQYYQHETKSGKADQRYSNNPLFSVIRYTYQCENENCGVEFSFENIEEE